MSDKNKQGPRETRYDQKDDKARELVKMVQPKETPKQEPPKQEPTKK